MSRSELPRNATPSRFARGSGAGAASGSRSLHRVAALGVLLACLIAGPRDADSAPAGHPNVLVILLDACRPDHLGCYGHARATSPNLDDLASQGALFENARSQASWTKPSIPTLFTGLYPIQHGVFTGNTEDTAERITSDVLAEEHVTLAEALSAAGYATGAFVHNAQISSFMGFAQGFDVYAEELGSADKITDRFLGWLEETPRRPFLAYVHFLEPHWPYTPPPPHDRAFAPVKAGSLDFNRVNWKYLHRQVRSGKVSLSPEDLESMRCLYDGEIRYTDAAVGRLFDELRTRGLYDETIVVVTADHGEEFLEHGGIGHGGSLYEEVLRVPLILRTPHSKPVRITDPVGTVDVMPTLLGLVGIEPPADCGGRSLRPLLEGETMPAKPIFADHRPNGERGRMVQSVHFGRHKLIRNFLPAAGDPEAEDPDWEPPEIRTGDWLEIEGVLQEDGSFFAMEIERLDAEEEVKLSGTIIGLDNKAHTFRLLGLPCRFRADVKFKDTSGKRLRRVDLADGASIQAKGSWGDAGIFEVRSIKIPTQDEEVKQEIKAPVEEVRITADEIVLLRMAGLQVEADQDTEFDGDWPSSSPSTGAAEGEKPESPSRASGAAAPSSSKSPRAVSNPATPSGPAGRTLESVELYDLVVDPAERTNLADEHPDLVRELLARLDGWELKYGTRAEAPAPIVLDQETLEKLRSLGYIR